MLSSGNKTANIYLKSCSVYRKTLQGWHSGVNLWCRFLARMSWTLPSISR